MDWQIYMHFYDSFCEDIFIINGNALWERELKLNYLSHDFDRGKQKYQRIS